MRNDPAPGQFCGENELLEEDINSIFLVYSIVKQTTLQEWIWKIGPLWLETKYYTHVQLLQLFKRQWQWFLSSSFSALIFLYLTLRPPDSWCRSFQPANLLPWLCQGQGLPLFTDFYCMWLRGAGITSAASEVLASLSAKRMITLCARCGVTVLWTHPRETCYASPALSEWQIPNQWGNNCSCLVRSDLIKGW